MTTPDDDNNQTTVAISKRPVEDRVATNACDDLQLSLVRHVAKMSSAQRGRSFEQTGN